MTPTTAGSSDGGKVAMCGFPSIGSICSADTVAPLVLDASKLLTIQSAQAGPI
jgi:hypothetical protein